MVEVHAGQGSAARDGPFTIEPDDFRFQANPLDDIGNVNPIRWFHVS
jgi:hypothetical protein